MPSYLKTWTDLESPAFQVQRLEVPPLSSGEIAEWLEESIEENLAADEKVELADHLCATTDGIPLYLAYVIEDLARSFADLPSAAARKQFVTALPTPFAEYVKREIARCARDGEGEPAWDRSYQRLFGLLARIRGPIRVDEIEAVFGDLPAPNLATTHYRFSRWLSLTASRLEGETSMKLAHPRLATAFAEALPTDALAMELRLFDWMESNANDAFWGMGIPSSYTLDWYASYWAEKRSAPGFRHHLFERLPEIFIEKWKIKLRPQTSLWSRIWSKLKSGGTSH